MTIGTTTSRVEYAGNGVTTVFAFPYPFFADGDLTVLLLRSTGVVDTLVLNTDYTVSGENTASSGQVTLMTAPASGETLFILRELDLTQETGYISGDPFPAESHERALDRLTLIDQQQQEQLGRSLKLNPASPSGVSTELPTPKPNALIGWNTAGDGLQNYVGTSSALVSTAMEPVVAAATLADARSEFGATAVGEAVFTAANALAARNSLGLGAGADIASAATLPLAGRAGNLVRVTGTVATTATDLENGGQVWCYAVGAWPLTYHATNMPVQGGQSYTCAAGDVIYMSRNNSGELSVLVFPADGQPIKVVSQAKGGTGYGVTTRQVAQVVEFSTGAVATGTTQIPTDDTIPQITEGDQYLSVRITPKNASSTLVIEVLASLSSDLATGNGFSMALFKDAIANALAARFFVLNTANYVFQLSISHSVPAGSTSAQTFRMRAGGGAAGTTTLNGSGGTRRLGGVLNSVIRVTEYLP